MYKSICRTEAVETQLDEDASEVLLQADMLREEDDASADDIRSSTAQAAVALLTKYDAATAAAVDKTLPRDHSFVPVEVKVQPSSNASSETEENRIFDLDGT